MFFEAISKGKKYEIVVNEQRESYRLEIKCPESHEDFCYNISKADYCELDGAISFLFKNSSYLIDVVHEEKECTVYTRGSHRSVEIINDEILLHESLKKGGLNKSSDGLTAAMPGKITKILVKEGQEVETDQALLIMEAMKMENEMRAPHAICVKKIFVQEGDAVEVGAELISFKKKSSSTNHTK